MGNYSEGMDYLVLVGELVDFPFFLPVLNKYYSTNIQQNYHISKVSIVKVIKYRYFGFTNFILTSPQSQDFFLSYFLALSILFCSRFIATMAVFLFLYSWVNFNGFD